MAEDLPYDVFLSYNSADKPAIEELARRLAREGIRPWLDRWHLIPGEPWQEAVEEALEQSETVAVFVGPSGVSPWHNEELRAALDRAVRTRDDYRVIPVLLPGAADEVVTGFLARRTAVDFRPGLDDVDAFARLVAGVRGQPPERAERVGAFTLPDEPAPYPGLLPFTTLQAGFFFGRGVERDRLLARVHESSFVAVVGASGCGKSSLVLAGLLPALDQDWLPLVLTPGARPLRALADQLATLVPPPDRLRLADELETRLVEREDGLSTAVSTLLADRSDVATLLIVVDQFEELFTQVAGTPDETQRQQQQFIANLVDAAHTTGGRVHVALTLRADFLRHCLDFPGLCAILESNQLLLGPMSQDGLREAIVRPAQAVGALFEKGLVGRLLDDMRGQSAALPLLSFTLAQLWQRRHGVWLTHAAYEAIGGVSGAIDQRADAVYARLTEAQQRLARNLFTRLVALGEDISDTRRRVRREELDLVGTTAADVDALLGVLSRGDVRLITADADTVELAHEALIAQWDRLRRWLQEGRAVLRVHRDLTGAAQEWDRHGRDESYLYRGTRLATAEKAIPAGDLSTLERDFVQASVDARQADRRVHHRRLLLRGIAVGLALLLLVAVGVVVWQQAQYEESTRPAWQPVAGFPNDPVAVLVVTNETPPTCYAGTESIGVVRSRDGVTWTVHRSGLPTHEPPSGTPGKDVRAVVRLAIDELAPERVFASVWDNGVYRSQDSGETWLAANIGLPQGPTGETSVGALAVRGDRVFAVVASTVGTGLYASLDGGDNWQSADGQVEALRRQAHTACIVPGGDGVYVGTDDGLYRGPAEPPWTWERVAELASVQVIAPATGDGLYLATYTMDEARGDVYLYRSPGQLSLLATVGSQPIALAPHPDSAASVGVYVLCEDGTLLAVCGEGETRPLERRPGFAYTLLAVPRPANQGVRLLLGHDDGLLEYEKALE